MAYNIDIVGRSVWWIKLRRREAAAKLPASAEFAGHSRFVNHNGPRFSLLESSAHFLAGMARHQYSGEMIDANLRTERHDAGNAGPVRAANGRKRIFSAGPGGYNGK
jgi:hypothetical protein